MASASQILEIVSAYLLHGDSDKFVLEFSAASHNIHKSASAEAVRLANEIESFLADVRGGFISKSVFLENLSALVKPSANNYVYEIVLDCSGSVNQMVAPENSYRGLAEFFGTSLGAGCALTSPAR